MSLMFIDSGTLTDIADAIRAKTGDSNSMTPLEMPTEIANIPTSIGGEVLDVDSVTANSAVTTYTNPINYTATANGLLIIYTGESNTDSRASAVTINGVSAEFGSVELYHWFNMGHALTFVNVKNGDVVSVTYRTSRKYQILFIPTVPA